MKPKGDGMEMMVGGTLIIVPQQFSDSYLMLRFTVHFGELDYGSHPLSSSSNVTDHRSLRPSLAPLSASCLWLISASYSPAAALLAPSAQ